ncbi:MAG: helix-hairpin-helix domain-containing protein [Candidatus Aureabacteria bacterium]|nr:helix-hairpin-helix domain-containing protein [Candidatus Auribacterota bacterium]
MKRTLIFIALTGFISPLFAGSAYTASQEQPGAKIDVNKASSGELQSLYLMGHKRANAVIGEREKNGPFVSLRDLAKRVKGIGPVMIKKWEPYVIIPMGEEEDNKKLPYPIDVNTASEQELAKLYRVGPVIAKRIVEERGKNGSFLSLENLSKRVKGVGPTLIGQWKDKVTNAMSESH